MKTGLSISPLDGRYADNLSHLSKYFSEYALVKKRCQMELLYLVALDNKNLFAKLPKEKLNLIDETLEGFDYDDFMTIKDIENDIKHDVKACEYYLKEKLCLGKNENMIHFGLTSEDINNLAYTSLFNEFLLQEHLPLLKKLILKLVQLAEKWKQIAFPARTHGQKASPTTAGKEIAVFISRLMRYYEELAGFQFTGKLNGATGNFSAMVAAFKDFDWIDFSQKFIEELGFSMNPATTQIEDRDKWADYFNISRQINNVIIDLNRDIWLYISQNLFAEKSVKNEVGSSTMPHKVNPINFENSEGNLELANSLFGFFSDKLTHSRMQRDLSDSTVERNIGVAFSHTHLAFQETLHGLKKLRVNQDKCTAELENSPQLLAEPVQSILRSAGVEKPYNLLKNITRGNEVEANFIDELIMELPLEKKYIDKLKSLSVVGYTGRASKICEEIIAKAKKQLV